MKTLAEIEQLLQGFEKRFGLSVRGHEQLSPAWFNTKLGVISSSNASRAVSKKGTATRNTYLCELVAEVCTGVYEEINAAPLEWGRAHEDAARSAYEFENNVKVTPLTFVFKDDTYRVGCSSDGILEKLRKGTEIKCPWDSANYVKFVVGDEMKPEWVWQNQMGMWVMGADLWDVTQYDPRMKVKPVHTVTVERDPEAQKKLGDAIPELIHDMDLILKQFGIAFGDHWKRLALQERETA